MQIWRLPGRLAGSLAGQKVSVPCVPAVGLLERLESSILADLEASRLAGWQLLAGAGWPECLANLRERLWAY